MLGVGVMIQSLGGNAETVNTLKGSLKKTIKRVCIIENELLFTFTDGSGMKIFDDGQSCCENRYMNTSDDLTEYEDAVLLDFELKDVTNENTEYEDHEIQFLDIKTDKGVFQISNHNEHNGYYGGFWIVAQPL